METNVKVIGFSNKRINGKTLDSKGFDLDYDGKYLDVNAFDNDRQYYTRLDNQDIMQLLNIPSSQIPLEQRIMQFNVGSNYNKPKPMLMEHPMFMHNQTQKPNQIIMYYKSKPNYKKYKTRRLSLNRHSRQTPKTRKITYARVSSIKRPSSIKPYRISKISRKSKPVSSIRQTIY